MRSTGHRKVRWCSLCVATQQRGHVGSRRECTRILGLDSYRVERLEWEAEGPQARVRILIERRGIPRLRLFGMWPTDVARPRCEGTDMGRLALSGASRDAGLRPAPCPVSDVRDSHRTGRICRRARPHHASVAAIDRPRLPIDAHVPRRGASRRQLEQSTTRGESLLDQLGSRAASTPAAASGRR